MEDLSNEELECVLGFLETPKDLGTAAAVCHRWAVRASLCATRSCAQSLSVPSREHIASVSFMLSVTLSFCLSVYLFLCFSVCLSVSLSLSLSLSPSLFLSL
eukprot:COSAG02_NODE_541_length_20598_cov_278.953754_13_plen_102_part_00